MGARAAKLSAEEIKDLQQCTYFDKKELQQWFKDFMKDCPTGYLKKEQKYEDLQKMKPTATRNSKKQFHADSMREDATQCSSQINK